MKHRVPFITIGLIVSGLLPGVAQAQVSGVIRDAVSGEPLSGARVTLQATTSTTVADVDGRFVLPDITGSELVVVGASVGYFNASRTISTPASDVEILLDPVPQDDDPTYAFMAPSTCGACHPTQLAEWTGSPMHRAGRNTWVYDIYDGTGTAGGMGGFVYTRDSEFADTNPASECAACHQPEPWVESPYSAMEPIGSLSEGAHRGVSCETCHKIADVDETRLNYPGLHPDVVAITRPAAPDRAQVQYGVLADSDYTSELLMRSSYQPQLTAAVCGACHQDKNDPDEDGDFEEANGVISEPTYHEWRQSPYADPDSPHHATCVDCHMPPSGIDRVCEVLSPPLLRDPSTIRSHDVRGTTPEFLENAVTMTLDAEVIDDLVEVEVVVANDQTGHHVPTGVTVRNVILRLDAWREEDGEPLDHLGTQLIHELGGVGDPDQGYLAGLPGKLYAKVNHDAEGHGPVFYTEATGIQFDTRIPALVSDTTRYVFAVPEGSGTLNLRADLLYRRAFRAFVDAKGWTEDGHGNPLADATPPYYGHLMEQETWTSTPVGVATVSPPIRSLTHGPNPTGAVTDFRFEIDEAAGVRLVVHDLQGRVVREVTDGARPAGLHTVRWNGTREDGSSVPDGIYFYTLSVGRSRTSGRLVLLR